MKENIEENIENQTKEGEKTPSSDELLALLQRKQAEFENYRKQSEKRSIEMQEMSTKHIIIELLPVVDNFTLALKNTESHEDFVTGVKNIHEQLMRLLEDHQVKIINTGGKFDPHKHEALMKTPSEKEEDEILEVFQNGFTLHDKVIRHAKVKVSAGKEN